MDASRSVLRKRIDEVKMKKSLERCWRYGEFGWNYHSENPSSQHYKFRKRQREAVSELSEMAVLVFSTLSLTVMSGTVFLILASVIIHHL